MSRPETLNSPELFYNDAEAKKYNRSSRMINIQTDITTRALGMLGLPEGKQCYLLDIGCGSGLSGQVLEAHGHYWVGCDISESMLGVARREMVSRMEAVSGDRQTEDDDEEVSDEFEGDMHASAAGGGGYHTSLPEALLSGRGGGDPDEDEEYDEDEDDEDEDDDNPAVEIGNCDSRGDVLLADNGLGLPFRPGSFDGVVSVSAIQWLCYSNASDQDPKLRLNRFFSSLYSVLKKDARAVLQFYPESPEQAFLIAQAASKVGFAGGLVVDYPNSTKSKKYYLVLSFERTFQVPTSLGNQAKDSVGVIGRGKDKGKRAHKAGGKPKFKSKDWVLKKKETAVKQGKKVKTDSKYSGRSRGTRF